MNAKIYATEPDYDLSDYTKAYQWIQKKDFPIQKSVIVSQAQLLRQACGAS